MLNFSPWIIFTLQVTSYWFMWFHCCSQPIHLTLPCLCRFLFFFSRTVTWGKCSNWGKSLNPSVLLCIITVVTLFACLTRDFVWNYLFSCILFFYIYSAPQNVNCSRTETTTTMKEKPWYFTLILPRWETGFILLHIIWQQLSYFVANITMNIGV